ncbi:MAG: hypothetical protein DU429_05340 [Candidatus Tokpelaia sp.]|uniref:hypothetical protein n=1 Tax=Candidatus Tokpelaia sp. TaxID=2233777 RepID=UPI00123929CE|nr:hypothetical protein [Candidatus Tokpelaia sp.]KAA6206881.1 MAG: hypothetical protein DU429_05340 [Candidatus Tokpelaia sp.]
MRYKYSGLAVLGAVLAGCSSVRKPYAELPPTEQIALVSQYKQACSIKGEQGKALQNCVNNEINKHDTASLEQYRQHRQDMRAFWY